MDRGRLADAGTRGDGGQVGVPRRGRRAAAVRPPADRLVALVVDDDHDEVLGLLLADGHELAELHQHRAVTVEAHDLAVGERQRQPERQTHDVAHLAEVRRPGCSPVMAAHSKEMAPMYVAITKASSEPGREALQQVVALDGHQSSHTQLPDTSTAAGCSWASAIR